MIAKIPPKRKDGRSSFHDLITYCFGPQLEFGRAAGRAAYANSRNVRDIESAALEMASVASFNVRCKDPVFHFILSWRELELPTNEQVDEAVNIALEELDLQNCQAVWALQTDTENKHAHVIVNRIDPETGKAVQPAGNWTYKALERAARKIEITQGWEIEKTGRYASKDGEVAKDSREEAEPRISQTARDIEAHTAQKSAERIGQETAAPIIRDAKTWEELHKYLAERGIAFERKGSGAVLHIGEAVIKASQAGRDISLSKLEKRLGEYQERDVSVEIGVSNPEAIERVQATPKVKRSWDDYQKARKEYYAAKDKAARELQSSQKSERDALYAEQKDERKRLFEISWQGKGTELNQRRSLMAANQQKAKLGLRDQQEKERKELRAAFPSRFPNFKTWLEQEANPELSAMFRYREQLLLLGDNARINGNTDLRGYTPTSAQKGGVAYVKKKESKSLLSRLVEPQADFIDYGRKILLSKDCDEAAILAAFQLASQKWGAVRISGTEEYKKMCVEIAIKHNFKIANPDLRLTVEDARVSGFTRTQNKTREKALTHRTQIERSEQLFERYADAVGAARYRIVATEFTHEGIKAFVFDKKNGGLDGKTREEIVEAMPKLHTYVKYNKNICVVPMSTDKHHILVDDLTPEKLRQFKEDGYSPACVVESSPGNFQAIVTIPKLGINAEEERQAANKLTRELNQQYGDPKLSGAVHAHRLPPFPNLKPKHRQEDGTFPETVLTEDNGGICNKAAGQLEEIYKRIKRETYEQQARIPAFTGFTGANDPNAAYWAHYRDIFSRLNGTPDYSSIDGKIGIRMRATGYSAGQIYEAIRNNAPAMRKETMSAADWSAKYRSRNWNRFAKETVEKYVFGPRGANQYRQAESFRPYYLKVEGRNEEIRKQMTSKDLGR